VEKRKERAVRGVGRMFHVQLIKRGQGKLTCGAPLLLTAYYGYARPFQKKIAAKSKMFENSNFPFEFQDCKKMVTAEGG
jgi:hypothetical protein